MRCLLRCLDHELAFHFGDTVGLLVAASARNLLRLSSTLRRSGSRFRYMDYAGTFLALSMDFHGVSRHILPNLTWPETYDSAAVDLLRAAALNAL